MYILYDIQSFIQLTEYSFSLMMEYILAYFGLAVRVFANGPSHTNDSKNGTWCLLA